MISTTNETLAEPAPPDHDVIVIGAGIGGMYTLYRLRELGMDVAVLEACGGLGGTWFRNRYPGCRFDSESYTYGYSFSQEVLDEWNWSELFASQPETLRYLEFVADKFDLRAHIQFDTRVDGATFDEAAGVWTVIVADGRRLTSRFLVTALGVLSCATAPKLADADSFRGLAFHTINWPEGLDLTGKRVAVIGTGSSGVQVISEIADEVESLTVFQLRAGWCAPLHNAAIDESKMEEIRASYPTIFELCRRSPSGFAYGPDRRKALEVPEAERLALWEQLYESPGMGIWLANFVDTLIVEDANDLLSEFIAKKIRARVADPDVAEKLVPKDHGFGTLRVALETGYYEVYNRPNVELVDLLETPIERLTPGGLKTTDRECEFDIIVYATGFDAYTGPFDHIDIVGRDGLRLRDKWADGPITTLGTQVHGFPNMMMMSGPQGGSGSTNVPRGLEEIVDWTADLLRYMRDNDYTYVEPTADAEARWLDHVRDVSNMILASKVKSWFTGHNVNLDRDDKPRLMMYAGGNVRYRARLTEEQQAGYHSFIFRTSAVEPPTVSAATRKQ